MESKSTFFILIIIVAVLALALAALTGYLFIMQGRTDSVAEASDGTENEKAQDKEIPKEEDLVKIPLFDDTRFFNLKNSDNGKTSIIQVKVTLKCYKTLKENKKAVVTDMIAARLEEIQELVVRFFMTMTAAEVKDLTIMDKAKEDLTKQINGIMNEGVKKPEDIVYKVIFSEWLFQ